MRRVRQGGLCMCLCGWVGVWVSGKREERREDEGILKTPLLEILYNRSMNAFDLTHMLGVWKRLSSLIHMCFFVLFFSFCAFFYVWFLLTCNLFKSRWVQKRMKVCSFQEENAMQMLPGTEMSQIHGALFPTYCCCCMTPHLLSLVFLRQIIKDFLCSTSFIVLDHLKCIIQSKHDNIFRLITSIYIETSRFSLIHYIFFQFPKWVIIVLI